MFYRIRSWGFWSNICHAFARTLVLSFALSRCMLYPSHIYIDTYMYTYRERHMNIDIHIYREIYAMQTYIIPYSIMRVLVKHVSCVCQNPHTAFCFFSVLSYCTTKVLVKRVSYVCQKPHTVFFVFLCLVVL